MPLPVQRQLLHRHAAVGEQSAVMHAVLAAVAMDQANKLRIAERRKGDPVMLRRACGDPARSSPGRRGGAQGLRGSASQRGDVAGVVARRRVSPDRCVAR